MTFKTIRYALPHYIIDDLKQIGERLQANEPTDYEATYEALLDVIAILCVGQNMETGLPDIEEPSDG